MPDDSHEIYSLDKAKLIEQIQNLAITYCSSEHFPEAWEDISSIQSDKHADALIRIFARMMERVIHRLNKVPDKNFLTFLDLVGVRLSPPRVARVPLTFGMSSGASRYVSVPAGTQVATAWTKGQEAVVFETKKELTVIAPELVKAVSISPYADKWTDHSPGLFDSIEDDIKLFIGRNLTPHRLYLGHSKLFSFREEYVITLEIEIPEDSLESEDREVKWYYFDKNSVPRPLEIEIAKSPDSSYDSSDNNPIDPKVANLLKSGFITFKPVAGVAEKTLSGTEKVKNRKNSWKSNWIFAELNTPLPPGEKPEIKVWPKISSIKAHVDINHKSVIPDIAFFNSMPLDLSKDFYPFGERPRFNDTFYIGSKAVFSKKGAKVTVGVTLSNGLDAPASEKIKLCWESWNGNNWEIIGEAEKDRVSVSKYNFTDETQALTVRDGERIVTFTCPSIKENEIYGEKNYWVRVRIIEGNYGNEARYEEAPTFKGTGKIYNKENSIRGNGTVFNQEIKLGDSIKILNSKGIQNKIVTEVISDDFLIINSPFINVDGENEFYVQKVGWTYLPATYKPPSISELTLEYTFASEDFPELILAYNDFTYQNYTHYLFNWDQVPGNENSRLLNYLTQNFDTGWVKEDAKIDKSKDNSIISISDAKSSFTLTLNAQANHEKVSLAINGIEKYEFTVKLEKNNKLIYDKTKTPFTPFRSVADKKPALYLAFDTDISTLPVTIFFPLLQARAGFSSTSAHGASQAFPSLIWQYWTGKGWDKLKVEDNTDNLTKRELIEFLAPANIAKRSCFGFESEHYWIRAVLNNGRYADFPSLKAIYTNTVWAHNMVTIKDEILGFSNGMPDQIFRFSRSPILGGQKVMVRELSLSEEDKRTIIFEEGEDAIAEIIDDTGNFHGFWVRWHEMKNFYFSKPYSRHYTADPNNGTITFGNGDKGMIPPGGKDNLKCSYQSGGGVKGNVQAGTITKLRTTFPYIDSVTNYEAADGGCDKENLDRIRERGPQTLKHRDRAVTCEDFEWLVREASPIIAKVKCLPTRDPSLRLKPGWVTLIVIPDSNDPKPLPSPQLVNEIEKYLFDRTSSHLTTYPAQINLIGPSYIKVWVEASVQFTSITGAKAIEKSILDNLQLFFHPLRGGPEKKGWDFGENVRISEVYELIENTNGVDYVNSLTLRAAVQVYKLKLKESKALSNSFPKHSTVNFNSGHFNQITFFLAESLPKDMIIDEFHVVGFKERDQVKISDSKGNHISTLLIKSVLDDKLECETDMAISVPKGSIVETHDGVRSYTTADSKQNDKGNILLTLATFSSMMISSGIEVLLDHRGNSIKEYLKISESTIKVETIFIDENCLIYSGDHAINK